MGTFYENNIYNNIKALCDSRTPRVSFSKMCVDLGLSKSLGTKLKENPDKSINGDTAQLIADYFGVSVDYILGVETKKTASLSGSGNEEEFMQLLSMLTPEEQEREIAYLREIVRRRGTPSAE